MTDSMRDKVTVTDNSFKEAGDLIGSQNTDRSVTG